MFDHADVWDWNLIAAALTAAKWVDDGRPVEIDDA